MLRDMLIQPITECSSDEQTIRQLQTVGMLHGANRFQLLTMDIPNGHICQVQHLEFHEVTSRINDPLLAFVLKGILRVRAIVMQTLELVRKKKINPDDLDEFSDDEKEDETLKWYKTPPIIVLPLTFMTPQTEHVL